jgi:hypothetical protein
MSAFARRHLPRIPSVGGPASACFVLDYNEEKVIRGCAVLERIAKRACTCDMYVFKSGCQNGSMLGSSTSFPHIERLPIVSVRE